MVIGDDIGDWEQWLCCLLMTQICPGQTRPYFRVVLLGDKHPTFDLLVELLGKEPYCFLVQVKSTRQGYRQGKKGRRLRVNVDWEDVQRMVASPIPAYVVGIDELQEIGYILSMNEARPSGLGGLPAKHLVDCGNLQFLWQEVHDFWASRKDMGLTGSRFV